jgi:ATP-binding cassette subfamily C (CFTR/MRP) protein 1
MADSVFISTFCSVDDYKILGAPPSTNTTWNSTSISNTTIQGDSPIRGISFTLGQFSPCFNDIAVIGGCNLVLILLCVTRMYQMCSTRFYHYKLLQPTLGLHYFHASGSFLVALMAALQLSGSAGSEAATNSMVHPFEVLTFAIFIVTWLTVGMVYLCETCEKFEKQGSSLLSFGQLLVLAGMSIKLYYLVELKSKNGMVTTWSFFEILFLIQYTAIAAMSLLSLCYLPGDKQFVRSKKEVNNNNNKAIELQLLQSNLGDATSGGLTIESNGQTYPQTSASCCSLLFFSWMTPLMKLGFKRPLENADMWTLPKNQTTDVLASKFIKHWKKEKQRAAATTAAKQKASPSAPSHTAELPSLTRALYQTFGTYYLRGTFLKIFNDASQFVGPTIMKSLIIFVRSQTTDTPQPIINGYLLAVTMYVAMFIGALAEAQYFQIVMTTGLQVRGVMISTVFDKAMILSQRGRKGRSTGKMTNLVSSDAENLQTTCQNLNTIWSAPLRIIVAMYLLYYELSWAALLGFLLLVVSIPIQGKFVKYQRAYYKQTAKMTDTRLKHANEAVSAMNVIKMYAWQASMGARITDARNEELKVLKKAKLLGAWNTVMISAVPICVTIVAFSTYALAIGDLTAEKAFTSIALFGILRYPLIQIPQIIAGLVGANVSLERLRDFLTADTVPAQESHNGEDEGEGKDDPNDAPIIHIDENASFAWDVDSKDADMHSLNVSVNKGELLTVVGRTGSGKSSLLNVMLNELTCLNGTKHSTAAVEIKGSVAYVPQESWIFNNTLRENILFGLPYDAEKYNHCITVAQMTSDLDQMADGDATEIGEKGVNLSGGQRQRVAIARAVYADADVYLFDDPLSALDAKVARKIYEHCICGALKEKTIVLVTNRIEFVSGSDRVAVMNNGTIGGIGTYSWLLDNNEEFQAMMEGISDASTTKNGKEEETDKEEKGKEKIEAQQKKETKKDNEDDETATTSKKNTPSSSNGNSNRKGALISKEHRDKGSIKLSVVLDYGRAMGGISVLITMVLLYCLTEGINVGATYWVSFWSADEFNLGMGSSKYIATYVGGYAGFSFAAIVFTLLSAYVQTYSALAAAKTLHAKMIASLLRAPMSFFHATPLGRILNRFSKDQNDVDKTMEFAVGLLIRGMIQLTSTFIVIGLATPYTLLTFVPVLFAFVYCQRYFQRSSRELKRMDAVTRSPVYAHFSECLNGLSTIRAYKKLKEMSAMNRLRIDNHLRMNLASFSANRWLGIRMELLGGLLVFASAVFVVAGSKQIDPEQVGLQLSYAIRITGLLNLVVRILSLAENSFNSVERLREYANVPSELPDESTIEQKPPSNWPNKGQITFEKVVARYRKDLEPVLTGLTFDIKEREKIGIVGRTGAGKSSLFLTLFRIMERDEGLISIDGHDIANMGLNDLRRALSIIPQEPVLFSGTVRFNLDPFNEYDDGKLWFSLERAHLKEYVKNHGLGISGLDMQVGQGGSNFSVGQRQLLCLARALLKGSKILVLDEATAAVDVETDQLIQNTIREAFKHCTTLTIAHRLNTIIDSDRVLVLDRGHVLEYDTPFALLENDSSAFSSMVAETGTENALHLRRLVKGEVAAAAAAPATKATDNTSVGSIHVEVPVDANETKSTLRTGSSSSQGKRGRGESISHLKRSEGEGGAIPSKTTLQQANNAIATLRDLIQVVGGGGVEEDRLRKELADDGLVELTWLQRLHAQLVRLNVLIDEHTEELVQEKNSNESDARMIAEMLH